jgi:hypothetical protein
MIRTRIASLSTERFLAVTCLVGYWLIAHGIGDFYPISPLGMFRDKMTSASRIVARPLGGAPIEIAYYVDWHCDGAIDFSSAVHPACEWNGFSAYDSIVADYILSHQGPASAGVPVEIVRRQFTIPQTFGEVLVTDCALLSCTARRITPTRWTPRL